MPKITESEWKLAMEESSRAIAFCPHPDSKTVREIAAEIGKSIHRTECLLVDMVERGNAKRLMGTILTGRGYARAASYYLLAKKGEAMTKKSRSGKQVLRNVGTCAKLPTLSEDFPPDLQAAIDARKDVGKNLRVILPK